MDNGGDLTSATTKMSLKGGGDVPSAKTIKVTEKGTYYLYSSKDPKTPIFEKELKKGEELGFSVHGDLPVRAGGGDDRGVVGLFRRGELCLED